MGIYIKPHVVNEARRQLISAMHVAFSRESLIAIEEMVDWMIDNEWISNDYYSKVEKDIETKNAKNDL